MKEQREFRIRGTVEAVEAAINHQAGVWTRDESAGFILSGSERWPGRPFPVMWGVHQDPEPCDGPRPLGGVLKALPIPEGTRVIILKRDLPSLVWAFVEELLAILAEQGFTRTHGPRPRTIKGRHGGTMGRVRSAYELVQQGLSKTEACRRARTDTRTYDRYVDNLVWPDE